MCVCVFQLKLKVSFLFLFLKSNCLNLVSWFQRVTCLKSHEACWIKHETCSNRSLFFFCLPLIVGKKGKNLLRIYKSVRDKFWRGFVCFICIDLTIISSMAFCYTSITLYIICFVLFVLSACSAKLFHFTKRREPFSCMCVCVIITITC